MGRKKSIIRAGSKFYENIKLTAANYDQNCEDECCSKLKDHEGMIGLSLQALLDYINSDNINGLRSFLPNKHVQIDEADEDGWTALTYAVSQGKLEAVEILISHGANQNQISSENTSLLHHAAIEGHVSVAAKLLELGAEVDARDSGSWTPLLWACYTDSLEMASLLLQHNADPNAKGLYHCTGVVWAAGRGNLEMVRLLISHGAKCDMGDKYGTTPLIWACRAGHASVVEELLDQGAQVDTVGMYSWTPLLMSVKGNYSSIVSMLLNHSPNVNAVDQDGLTAMATACKEGNSEIVFQLLSSGAYVNLQDKAGDTNLIIAAKAGHKTIVDALIKRYADLDTKGKDNKTCLYWAVEKNHPSVVKTLLTAGADIEIPNCEGNTALLRAVKNRNLEIVQMLIEKKAKLSAADKLGDTALHIAMRARSKAIVGALLKNPKHSQLLYKPNRAGETPYNIDVSNQKTILSLLFGSRKLNTNLDTENMLGYDLYGSVLADILTEPSLSMPITVGLYAKWGSGKSFLLSKLREEMVNFARDWVDPTFHFSPVLFLFIVHLSTILGVIFWIIAFFSGSSQLYGLISIPLMFLLSYATLFTIRKLTHKTDLLSLYDLNVFLAKRFNELKLLVNVVFSHPPGSDWVNSEEKAMPLKLFFTDQSKVSTSAGAENSVVQIIGSLYDALESNYGTFSTRLFRAFRPRPVKSGSPQRLRKLCCIPYAALYFFSFVVLVLEVIIVIVKVRVEYGEMRVTDVKAQQNINDILLILAILLGVVLLLMVISNIYTIGQVFTSLMLSSRRHLQRTVAKHDIVQSEGYLQAVKNEVNLLQQMVKTLDAFSGQQSRLIVIVDGLDSVEQRKILTVLDTVHNLFSNQGNPFIIILAIDPHVIIKAIELNLNQVFVDTSIGGNAYLRNMVHLPFFLQNSGLRKVKVAQQLAAKKNPHHWMQEHEDTRRMSIESDDVGVSRSIARLRNKKKESYNSNISRENSIGSNLHKLSSGQNPMELNKMFLTDEYFSDVNPRSLRRLMNVIYVMGRLLKAFSIEFNWHHLSNWANITEQWPYRASWITLYVESCEDMLDDNLSLKHIYDKIKPAIPTKELEPLLCMDRDEKKLDAFLAYYRKTLTVANLKIFLPFTINLDPYLKKVIKEEVQSMEDLGIKIFTTPEKQINMAALTRPSPAAKQLPMQPNAPLTRRQAAGLSRKLIGGTSQENAVGPVPNYGQLPPHMMGNMMGLPWMPQQQMYYQQQHQENWFNNESEDSKPNIPSELKGKKLSSLSVDQVCTVLKSVDHIDAKMLEQYSNTIKSNNISGKVLYYCQTEDLKAVMNMSFGDWELFKILVNSLKREQDNPTVDRKESGEELNSVYPKLSTMSNESTQSRDNIRRSDSTTSRKRLSSTERQVALEEATVTGLLSTLNEDAQEDVLMEEKENESDSESWQPESDEADVLYYYNHTSSQQNIDCLSDNGMGQDVEKGMGGKKHREILWSAMSSRQGSTMADLDNIGTTSPMSSMSTTASQLSSILEGGAERRNPRSRTNSTRERGPWGEERASAWSSNNSKKTELYEVPVIQLKRSVDRGEEEKEKLKEESKGRDDEDEQDPYAWLSRTAPPSPGSTKRTKKKSESKNEETEQQESDDRKEQMRRVSSRERIKRRLYKALEGNEPGGLPAVQRARPSLSEYEEINRSCDVSRSPSPVPRTPRTPGSPGTPNSQEALSLQSSQESLASSPEQMTVSRRPGVDEELRPPLSNIFEKEKST